MEAALWLLAGVAVALLIAAWVRFRSPRPAFPPLGTDPDDPLMLAAMERARASLDRFRALQARWPQDAFVKLRFTSSSGEVEHLAAHVEAWEDERLTVLLVTPPVTHSGRVERRREIGPDEIEDWQVTAPDGTIHGGFTQRAMFEIARREGIKLPDELRRLEAQYAPPDA